MLKYAGWDGIVITGISEKPVYLRIEDDEVSLEDASDIWGKGTFAANKWMVEQNGREFETASIGLPVRIWWTTPPEHQPWQLRRRRSGRCMGNKKLKGLASAHRQRQGRRPQKGAGAFQLHDGQPHRRQQQSQRPPHSPRAGPSTAPPPARTAGPAHRAVCGKRLPAAPWIPASSLQRHQQGGPALLQGLLRLRRTGCGVHREERRLLLLPHPLLHRV